MQYTLHLPDFLLQIIHYYIILGAIKLLLKKLKIMKKIN
jgi:hypothetical protein